MRLLFGSRDLPYPYLLCLLTVPLPGLVIPIRELGEKRLLCPLLPGIVLFSWFLEQINLLKIFFSLCLPLDILVAGL